MNRQILGWLAFAAMVPSLSQAQLASVDNGAAAVDGNGLMWANTVGVDLSWSSTGGAGSAQGWIASLNADNYGGYNNWTLATGDGSVAANSTSNELGDLFYSDCGNSSGSATVFSNPGKNCGALSAVRSVIGTPSIFFSSSPDAALNHPSPLADFFFWTYTTPNSLQQPWTDDTQFSGGGLPLVGLGDALAVREAPEISAFSAGGNLTLLLGALAVLCAGRRIAA